MNETGAEIVAAFRRGGARQRVCPNDEPAALFHPVRPRTRAHRHAACPRRARAPTRICPDGASPGFCGTHWLYLPLPTRRPNNQHRRPSNQHRYWGHRRHRSHFAPRCPGITGAPLGRPVFLPLSAQWRRHQYRLKGFTSTRLVAPKSTSLRRRVKQAACNMVCLPQAGVAEPVNVGGAATPVLSLMV